MGYRVFSQASAPGIDPALLVRTATRHFEASLSILEAEPPPTADAHGRWLRLRLVSVHRAFDQRFRIDCRAATAEDWAAAGRAEQNGRSAGMSALAERCHAVWEISPESGDSPLALLNLCGILASAALGPVLPPDESALFGVRGAMERVDALGGRSLQR